MSSFFYRIAGTANETKIHMEILAYDSRFHGNVLHILCVVFAYWWRWQVCRKVFPFIWCLEVRERNALLILLGTHDPHLWNGLCFIGLSIPITCLCMCFITIWPAWTRRPYHRLLMHTLFIFLMDGVGVLQEVGGTNSWYHSPFIIVIGYDMWFTPSRCMDCRVSILLSQSAIIVNPW